MSRYFPAGAISPVMSPRPIRIEEKQGARATRFPSGAMIPVSKRLENVCELWVKNRNWDLIQANFHKMLAYGKSSLILLFYGLKWTGTMFKVISNVRREKYLVPHVQDQTVQLVFQLMKEEGLEKQCEALQKITLT